MQAFAGYYNNTSATEKKILRSVLAPGDTYFRTGDLLRRDADGHWYFADRLGDTFRWKSENVATTSVAEVLGEIVKEANVYGVTGALSSLSPTGARGPLTVCAAADSPLARRPRRMRRDPPVGWAGRPRAARGARAAQTAQVRPAALHPPRQSVRASLSPPRAPSRAGLTRRALPGTGNSLESTGTGKQLKVVLRNEGVDPALVGGDPVYWLHPDKRTYVPFTRNDWDVLRAGKVKL